MTTTASPPSSQYETATDAVVEEWVVTGVIDVDSGTITIGDPCYLEHGYHPLKNWDHCCDLLKEAGWPMIALLGRDGAVRAYNPEQPADAGLGLIISTQADGGWPVEARLVDGRVAELRIRIFGA